MADIFISYSHQNSNFVKQLNATLVEHGLNVWVDFDDIPFTTDWWHEIQRGIESADVVIFVISEHSLSSTVCNLEVAHARQYNKRFIPIVYQSVSSVAEHLAKAFSQLDVIARNALGGRNITALLAQNEEVITRHNWIFFTDEAEFDDKVTQLIEALHTDFDHVRMHTQLLTRALLWESKGRENSYLLSGAELQEADSWLEATDKEKKAPPLAALHLDYIASSHHYQRLRRRQLVGVAVFVLVVALGLGMASAFGFELIPPPPKQLDKVVNIVVLDFTVADGVTENAAADYGADTARYIRGQLEERIAELNLGNIVAISDDQFPPLDQTQSTKSQAQVLDTLQSSINANVVIYGTVDVNTQDQPTIIPNIYIHRDLVDAVELTGSKRFGTAIPVRFPLEGLNNAEPLIQEFIPRMEALTYFVVGLGMYKGDSGSGAAYGWFKRAEEVEAWQDQEGKEILYYWLASALRNQADITDCAVAIPETQFLSSTTCRLALYQYAYDLSNGQYVRAQMGIGLVYYDSAVSTHPVFGEFVDCISFDQAVASLTLAQEELPGVNDVINASLLRLKIEHNLGQAFAAKVRYPQCEGAVDAAIAQLQFAVNFYPQVPSSEDADLLVVSAAYQLGVMQFVVDNPEAALDAFGIAESIINKQPTYTSFHHFKYALAVQRGQVLVAMGDANPAIDSLNVALAAYPEAFTDPVQYAAGLLYRGDAYAQLGQDEKSTADYCAAWQVEDLTADTRAMLVERIKKEKCSEL